MNDCACGCAWKTNGIFASGHDKRVTDAVLLYITGYEGPGLLAVNRPDLVAAAMNYKEKHT